MSFSATANVDPAIADLGDVAGVQPALGVDRGARRLVVAPVAVHHVAAARQQLTGSRASLHLDTRQRRPDRLRIVVVARLTEITGDASVMP